MKKMNKSVKVKLVKHPLKDVACLWALRILLDLNGANSLLSEFGLTGEGELLRTIGLPELEGAAFDKALFLKKMQDRQVSCEKQPPRIKGVLKQNIQKFSKALDLSKSEIKIFEFSVAIHSHRGLENAAISLGYLSSMDIAYNLSIILKLPLKKVQKALSNHGLLISSGLMKLSSRDPVNLAGKLCLMPGLTDVLQAPQSDVVSMLQSYFQLSRETTLSLDDFSYLGKDFNLIKSYLNKSVKNRLTGVNVLVHGLPGTGKSEMVKVLAKALNINLNEISVADKYGEALTGNSRFSAYQLCQKILQRKKNALILFDEVEDVFPGDSLLPYSVKTNEDRRKAWINNLLENNPVPAIWVSNNIEQIDNAFIRRFDFVLKMDHPPKNVRVGILNKHFSALKVSPAWVDAVAGNPDIAPALVSRAAKVATVLCEDRTSVDTENSLEHIMGNTLKAMGYNNKVAQKNAYASTYRLDVLNPDMDIEMLVEGLKNHPAGRLCLYGPPGTGKTEFGHYVAKSLGKTLIVKRASDLLGSYVGMTEKNIANMYHQAKSEDAVLLLDEADSFLRDRNGAQHSWEVTQVNEMLTQMESYEGVFLCSTNLVDNLDAASLRRFDFKIFLDYLEPEQNWALFKQVLEDQGRGQLISRDWKTKLAKYSNLTPGDYTTVVRQNKLCKKALDAELLFSGLAKEAEFKLGNKSNSIGFMSSL